MTLMNQNLKYRIKMKIAVIIKHPYRDFDYRVDIVDVPDDTLLEDIREAIEKNMLGPFQVIAMTSKIDFGRKVELNKATG